MINRKSSLYQKRSVRKGKKTVDKRKWGGIILNEVQKKMGKKAAKIESSARGGGSS